MRPGKSCSVLVLLDASKSDIDPLDLKGQTGDVVLPERCAQERPERVDQRDHERGRRTESRTGGRVNGRCYRCRNRSSIIVVTNHPLVDTAVQLQLRLR